MFKDSRYNREKAFPLIYRGSLRRSLTFREIDRTVPDGSFLHTIKSSDTLDILAFKHLGSGEYWWMIADINPHIEPWDLGNYIGEQVWIPPRHLSAGRRRVASRATLETKEALPSEVIMG